MTHADEKLQNIAEQIKNGVVPPKETIRGLLLWFGASRRGYRVVRAIRNRLGKFGLRTDPDFEYAYIDGSVQFMRASATKSSDGSEAPGVDQIDPTYRVGRLASANRAPVAVNPDSSLKHIVTLMLANDYSQLPVMNGTRVVKGTVSWKTIGSRLALKKQCVKARDCMEPAPVISIEESLFSASQRIAEHDYVLVRASDDQICGIITSADFNDQFRKLSEPFLLVGEIEHGVRRILHGKFTAEELNEAKNPDDQSREVESVGDLTFGEYLKLIEEEKAWQKLKVEIDRVEFVKRLDRTREIRNDVMHFDPDGLDDGAIEDLREFAQFLKRLRDVGVV